SFPGPTASQVMPRSGWGRSVSTPTWRPFASKSRPTGVTADSRTTSHAPAECATAPSHPTTTIAIATTHHLNLTGSLFHRGLPRRGHWRGHRRGHRRAHRVTGPAGTTQPRPRRVVGTGAEGRASRSEGRFVELHERAVDVLGELALGRELRQHGRD